MSEIYDEERFATDTIMWTATKFMESAEMREYLQANRSSRWVDSYVDLIAGARAPLHKKAEALESIIEPFVKLRKLRDWDFQIDKPSILAEACFAALRETKKNIPPGTVFILKQIWRVQREAGIGPDVYVTPFSTFDAAIRYVTTRYYYEEKELDPCEAVERDDMFFEIGKWVPDNDGKMRKILQYTLSSIGVLWNFRVNDPKENEYFSEYDNLRHDIETIGLSLNLPVPFAVGDIITIDCTPFVELFHAVILEIGDNSDCCSVQCMYFEEAGLFNTGALKHNSFNFDDARTPSAMYRAERYTGELPEIEKPLLAISSALKEKPELGRKYHECLWENSDKMIYRLRTLEPDEDSSVYGYDWETFRNRHSI
jgi:hypothetical protein